MKDPVDHWSNGFIVEIAAREQIRSQWLKLNMEDRVDHWSNGFIVEIATRRRFEVSDSVFQIHSISSNQNVVSVVSKVIDCRCVKEWTERFLIAFAIIVGSSGS
jgi:hypothetical protein